MEERSPTLNLHEYSTADPDFFLNPFSNDDLNSELLILQIELADGKTEQLTLHEQDNLDTVVKTFCEKCDLGPISQEYLLEEIEKNLDAIYQNSLYKPAESIEQESREETSEIDASNKGCELYLKGIKMRQRAERKRQAFRNEREAKEMQGTTFKPRTNSAAKRNKPPEQILLEKGRQMAESIEKKRNDRDNKEMSDCTFSPEINKNSGKMKQSVLRSPERYKSLYQDAQNIQEKILRKSQEL
jgi:hypothetical protein